MERARVRVDPFMSVPIGPEEEVHVVTHRQRDGSWRSSIGELRGFVPHPAGVASTPGEARNRLFRTLSAAEPDLRKLQEFPSTSFIDMLRQTLIGMKSSTLQEDLSWAQVLDEAKQQYP